MAFEVIGVQREKVQLSNYMGSDKESVFIPYTTAGQLQQRPVPREGGMFKRHWFEIVEHAPALTSRGRAWDLASTEVRSLYDPDWTVGLAGGLGADKVIYLTDMKRLRAEPDGVEAALVGTAREDGRGVTITMPQDPGQAGKSQVRYYAKQLMGFDLRWSPESGSKTDRSRPVAAQAAAGNIKLVAGDLDHPPAWITQFLDEIELFPLGDHDDIPDALARLFAHLTLGFEAPTASVVEIPVVSPFAI
jgi:predicted phage terminase large subunit-like protein